MFLLILQEKGDIAFYGTNGADHVEIVYANNGGRISTIEEIREVVEIVIPDRFAIILIKR